jgi:beta-mannosidase
MSTKTISLNGEWFYHKLNHQNDFYYTKFDFDHAEWQKMNLPINWELAGIHDYHGSILFRKELNFAEKPADKAIFLEFLGVDYFATVWLNGHCVGAHEGYFQPFSFRVDKFLDSGPNKLMVLVESPYEEPGKIWPSNKRLLKGIFNHHDTRPGAWRNGQMKNTGGIWNDVYLKIYDPIKIEHLKVTSKMFWNDFEAALIIEAEIQNLSGEGIWTDITLKISGHNFHDNREDRECYEHVYLNSGFNKKYFTIKIANPELWNPWDRGTPNLYQLNFAVDGKNINLEETLCFGIREIAKDENGNWLLNGKRYFPRGTNMIPTQWLSEYNQRMIAGDIRLLKEANINAVRLHAHVNREEFYQACDEAGIIIWQDFTLQWSYQQGKEVVTEALRQFEDMVGLLYNHPSIVLWCCHNEPSINQDYLDPILYQHLQKLDSSRLLQERSDFSEHPYYGWYYGHYKQFEDIPRAPFVNEFGAQALPSIETMQQIFTGDQLWPPDWEEWSFHDFQYDQTFNVAGIETGNCLEEFIENSQSYQAEILKYAIESYRRFKYKKMTYLFQFMFVDCWPSITWSVVDYYRRLKMGYYALQQAYQPVLPSLTFERNNPVRGGALFKEFWITNDLAVNLEDLKVCLSLSNEKGESIKERYFDVTIPADSSAIILKTSYRENYWIADEQMHAGNYLLKVKLLNQDGEVSANNYPVRVVESTDTGKILY